MNKLIKNRNSALTFGKYKGKTIEDILKINPQYIKWLKDEQIVEITDLTDFELSALIIRCEDKRRYYAHERECDDYDSEMDFCLGLSGGAQGWN